MADALKHHTSNPTTDAIKGQDMSKVMRQCRYSWCLPLTGFMVTFICGVGLSLSNTNIRADVQSIGLGLFALWTVLGLSGTMRAVHAVKRYGGRTCLSHAIIATAMVTHPEVVGQIERIIMIGGKHPGKLLHPGTQWWMHFRDLNVSKDTPAVQTVLASGVPLILMPFALATNVTITRSDLQRLASGDAAAQWLRQVSEPWMAYWEQSLHKDGFYPFDVLAIGYMTMPDLFTCAVRPARIGFSIFLAPFGMGRDLEVAPSIRGTQVYYCFAVAPPFMQRFLARIIGNDPEARRDLRSGQPVTAEAVCQDPRTL
jgi:hypothetical protein